MDNIELKSKELNDEELTQVAGGANVRMLHYVCDSCHKFSQFMLISKKRAKCMNCGAIRDI